MAVICAKKNIPRGATVNKYGDHEPRVVHVTWYAINLDLLASSVN